MLPIRQRLCETLAKDRNFNSPSELNNDTASPPGRRTRHRSLGLFRCALKPVLTIESGDRVTISTVSGAADQMPGAPFAIPPALPAIHASVQRNLGPAYLHRAGGRARRQARSGAGGADRGYRTRLRLGLQHDPARQRRAAGRFHRAPADPHSARSRAHGRATVMGRGNPAASLFRRDGGRAARGLGRDLNACRRAATAAISTTRNWSPAPRSICRSMSTARCSRSATGTARRATARSASPRSRPGSSAPSRCICATT